ncbi:Helicase conserved C-terminal domain [Popillia japonica]|uniref:SWI/SNF-related matrix-associated actin-dependent regulator of chromatin subfamily A containing DEAD/H box 1 homolog n=1 Tax=Popillia japonica TaxID=7064 RepID=A0AAW1LXZ9_POPJA
MWKNATYGKILSNLLGKFVPLYEALVKVKNTQEHVNSSRLPRCPIIMPQESLIKLSEFRIQKKPTIMSGHLNPSLQNDELDGQTTPIRRRIIQVPDSDSDCESNGLNTKSDSAMQSTSSSSNSGSVKNETVASRELKIRYLTKMFPDKEPFKIYETLAECNFVINLAVTKLTDTFSNASDLDFETWKNSNSHCISNTVSNRSVSKIDYVKRKQISQNSSTKTKRCKMDVDEDSNESTDAKSYVDNRVYDSDEDSDVDISNELTRDKKRVFEFMQNATSNELQLMTSCSKKKIDAIIASRPFENWIDLVQKLQQNKNLSTDLLNSAQQVLVTRNNIKQLMKKCSNLSQNLEQAIRSDLTVKEQPRLLSPGLELTSYQLVGLNWLAVLHNQDVNGILADEMGLGKTVQVIAFLAYLKEANLAKTTHLIVVPSSTLENWQNEFERWCPDLNVLLYYGSTEERRMMRLMFAEGKHKDYDVVLTTYTMVSSSSEEKKMFRVTPMHYVVFDEAHMLKNMNTQRYECLIRIKASKRILLTGTPLQNNLLELMSLLIFVMPNIFSEKTEDLKNLFQKTSKAKDVDNDALPQFEREQIEHAKRIMKPFVLRRLKKDVLQDLPKKDDYMLQIPLAPTQEEQYINLVASFKEAGNNENVNYNGVTMMSDLRKLSNHPLLLRYHYQYEDLPEIAKRLAADPGYKDTVEQYIIEDLPEIAKRLAADPGYKDTVEQYIIDDLACMSDFEIHTMTKQFKCLQDLGLPDNLITTSGKFLQFNNNIGQYVIMLDVVEEYVLIFSQYVIMLDVVEEYLQIRQHSYLRLDGSTPVTIRQQLIDEFTEDPTIFIFLLSTKAGGLGINLTAADTVIIHDIDFNPYNDKQAEDRCHRMGQQNPVSVYRLISKGTIEEGMWQLTQEKLKLEKEITSDDYENTDVKSVVNLLSSALGIDSEKATNLVSPRKKS